MHSCKEHTRDPCPKGQLQISAKKKNKQVGEPTSLKERLIVRLFVQDVGKERAREVRAVVLALPRGQPQPEKRQKHFPRAQDISSRASPTSLLLESR